MQSKKKVERVIECYVSVGNVSLNILLDDRQIFLS
jgi:hypothetical protein